MSEERTANAASAEIPAVCNPDPSCQKQQEQLDASGGDPIFGTVLSIQSHVVHGYVGNRAAVLPLQLLGFETDWINSVQFSNHTGYKIVAGQKLEGKDVEQLFDGLRGNNLTRHYSHVLTGYMGTPTFLRTVLNIVRSLKQSNKGLIYVCDPVLGDEGKMYVPPELVEIYRTEVIPNADVITPNQFEAEVLSGVNIRSEKDALDAIHYFHSNAGVPLVVITSMSYDDSPHMLTMIASRASTTKPPEQYKISFAKREGWYSGTGDMVAALLLAWSTILDSNLQLAIEKTINCIQEVLRITPTGGELRLVQSKSVIVNPPMKIKAHQLGA